MRIKIIHPVNGLILESDALALCYYKAMNSVKHVPLPMPGNIVFIEAITEEGNVISETYIVPVLP